MTIEKESYGDLIVKMLAASGSGGAIPDGIDLVDAIQDGLQYLVVVDSAHRGEAMQELGFSPDVYRLCEVILERGWLDIERARGMGWALTDDATAVGEDPVFAFLMRREDGLRYGYPVLGVGDLEEVSGISGIPAGPVIYHALNEVFSFGGVRSEAVAVVGTLGGDEAVSCVEVGDDVLVGRDEDLVRDCLAKLGFDAPEGREYRVVDADVKALLDGVRQLGVPGTGTGAVVRLDGDEGVDGECYLVGFDFSVRGRLRELLGKGPDLHALTSVYACAVLSSLANPVRIGVRRTPNLLLGHMVRAGDTTVQGSLSEMVTHLSQGAGRMVVGVGNCTGEFPCEDCASPPEAPTRPCAARCACGWSTVPWEQRDEEMYVTVLTSLVYRDDVKVPRSSVLSKAGSHCRLELGRGKYVIKPEQHRGSVRFATAFGAWVVVPPGLTVYVDGYMINTHAHGLRIFVVSTVNMLVLPDGSTTDEAYEEARVLVEAVSGVGAARAQHLRCGLDPGSTAARCWTAVGNSSLAVGRRIGLTCYCMKVNCNHAHTAPVGQDNYDSVVSGVGVLGRVRQEYIEAPGWGAAVESFPWAVDVGAGVMVTSYDDVKLFIAPRVSVRVLCPYGRGVEYVYYEGISEELLDHDTGHGHQLPEYSWTGRFQKIDF